MKMRNILAALGISALLGVSVAWAAGMFPGLPSASYPITGTETIPADTGLSGGRQPQTYAVTPNLLAGYSRTPVNLTFSATNNVIDASTGELFRIILGAGGTTVIQTPTNLYPGKTWRLAVIQDGTGSRTTAWAAIFHWPAGTAPTLTATANRIDLMTFVCDGDSGGGTQARCFASSQLNFLP